MWLVLGLLGHALVSSRKLFVTCFILHSSNDAKDVSNNAYAAAVLTLHGAGTKLTTSGNVTV